jgi:hypothetical protein
MTNPFAPATREASKARIALCGPSGSGKTYTALTLATALADKVAVVDTEHGSASKYAPGKSGDGFAFDAFSPSTFDPRALAQTLGQAAAAGYGAIVIDSLTHYWAGPGGVLELVDNAAAGSRSGNSFAAWKTVRPYERQIIAALLGFPGHVIVTMRTKTEWVIEEDDRGRKAPKKLGMKPEQREGIEYEFDIVADLDQDNTLVVTKSRCFELSGAVVRKPDTDLAKQIAEWLDGGVDAPDANEYRDKAVEVAADVDALRALHAEVKRRQMLGAQVENENGDIEALGELIARFGTENSGKKKEDSE